MKFHLLCLFFLGICFMDNSSTIVAQEAKEESPPEKLTKQAQEYLDAQKYYTTVRRVSKMSREERNTIIECPLHYNKKEMPLSDNYRANASDYTTSYEYPFAYQLNYRRYCRICTKIMSKDSGLKMPILPKGSFERCAAHNAPLKGNPDYDNTMYEKRPNGNTPHARQYLFKYYCNTCTKIVKAETK
ncbi:MAG: hypothetical protein JKY03_00120 [Aureispira sp.]|nr:hypothetical protein [Aureispira sp.]